ncbi:unnamed protein product, partial [Prorocentrum cordatum]
AARCYPALRGGAGARGKMWSCLVHGFRAAFDGFHPALDPFGEEWPGGSTEAELAGGPIANGEFYGVLWQLPMDAEYACNECKVQHCSSHLKCRWCPADGGAMTFKN